MSKDIETKKTLKQQAKELGVLYLFICNFLATFYLLMVKVPSAPTWATYPIALGTAIGAIVAWYNK